MTSHTASRALESPSLYAIAGLDPVRWIIVGLDVSLGGPAEHVVLHAVDRLVEPDTTLDADDIPVTDFDLGQSAQVDQFLLEALQRVSVRLVPHSQRGQQTLAR
jgi:hypothetical protein